MKVSALLSFFVAGVRTSVLVFSKEATIVVQPVHICTVIQLPAEFELKYAEMLGAEQPHTK